MTNKDETAKLEGVGSTGVLERELLPCPFCGAAPEIRRQGNAHTKSRRVVIRCPGCRVERADAAIRNDMDWVERVAVGHWNERPNK